MSKKIRFCGKCGSDAVCPEGVDWDEYWQSKFQDWPKHIADGECECGHVGEVEVCELDTSVPYMKFKNTNVITTYTDKETQQMQDQMFDAGVGYGN